MDALKHIQTAKSRHDRHAPRPYRACPDSLTDPRKPALQHHEDSAFQRRPLPWTGLVLAALIALNACAGAPEGDASQRLEDGQEALATAMASLMEGQAEDALRTLDKTARWRRELSPELRGQLELLVGKANLAFAKQRIANGGGGAIVDGSFLDAQAALETAANVMREDAESLLLLSEAHALRNEFDPAVAAATRAVERIQNRSARGEADASLAPAYIARARARICKLAEMRGDGQATPDEEQIAYASKILADVSKAKNLDPREPESYQLASTTFRWIHRFEEAIRALEDGVRAHPNHNPHHSALQGMYFGQKRGAALVGLYRRLVRENERPSATTVWWLGRALYAHASTAGDRESANKSYDEAAGAFAKSAEMQASDSGSTDIYRALCTVSKARMALEEGDQDFTEAELDRAYAITPRIAEIDENGFDRWFDDFRKTYRGGIFALGKGFMGAGAGLENAIRFFRKITARHEDWGQAWNNLGFAARDHAVKIEQGGDKDAAKKLYEESFAAYKLAAKLSPQDARIQNDAGLMLVYHLHREIPFAIAQFEKAIRIGSEQLDELPDADDDADLKAQRKNIEEAVGDAWGNWGLALEQQGKIRDAVSKYEKAIEFYPFENREVAARIRRLRKRIGTAEASDKRQARVLRSPVALATSAALFAIAMHSGAALRAQGQGDAVAEALEKIAAGEGEAALSLVERGLGKSSDAERWFCAGMGSLLFAKQRMAAQASGVEANLIDAVDRLQKADALTRKLRGGTKHLGTSIHTEPVRYALEALLIQGKAADALEFGQRHLTHLDSLGLDFDKVKLAGLYGQVAAAAARKATADYQAKSEKAKETAATARGLTTRYTKALASVDDAARAKAANAAFALFKGVATMEEWAGRGVAALRTWERGAALLPSNYANTAAGQVTAIASRTKSSDKAATIIAKWRKAGKGDRATLAWYEGYAKVFAGHEHRMGSRLKDANKSYASARKDFEAAKRSNPGFAANSNYWIAMSWAAEGSTAKSAGERDKALALWMKAVKTDARVAVQADSLGQSAKRGVMLEVDELYKAGKLDGAAELAERYLDALGTDDKNILNNIGFFWRDHAARLDGTAQRKAYRRSWKAYKRAAALASDDPRVLTDAALIDIYYIKEQPKECERLCRRAIRVGEATLRDNPPEDEDARNALEEAVGDAYMNLGVMLIGFEKRWDEAETLLKKSMSFYPAPRRASPGHLRRLRRLRAEKKGGE